MVEDPSRVSWPFVQVWVSNAADHKACPMSQGDNKEVKSEKMEGQDPWRTGQGGQGGEGDPPEEGEGE